MEEISGEDARVLAALRRMDGRIADTLSRMELSHNVDPALTCALGRRFLEFSIRYIDKSQAGVRSSSKERLVDTTRRLTDAGILPRLPTRWAHTLRELGNVGSHAGEPEEEATFDDASESLEVAKKFARWLASDEASPKAGKEPERSEPSPERVQTAVGVSSSSDDYGANENKSPIVSAIEPKSQPDTPSAAQDNGQLSRDNNAQSAPAEYQLIIVCKKGGKWYFLFLQDQMAGPYRIFRLAKNLPPKEKIGKILTNALHLDIQGIRWLFEDKYMAMVKKVKGGGNMWSLDNLVWVSADSIGSRGLGIQVQDREVVQQALVVVEHASGFQSLDGWTPVRKEQFVWRG